MASDWKELLVIISPLLLLVIGALVGAIVETVLTAGC